MHTFHLNWRHLFTSIHLFHSEALTFHVEQGYATPPLHAACFFSFPNHPIHVPAHTKKIQLPLLQFFTNFLQLSLAPPSTYIQFMFLPFMLFTACLVMFLHVSYTVHSSRWYHSWNLLPIHTLDSFRRICSAVKSNSSLRTPSKSRKRTLLFLP